MKKPEPAFARHPARSAAFSFAKAGIQVAVVGFPKWITRGHP
jgi:hypothetical protein